MLSIFKKASLAGELSKAGLVFVGLVKQLADRNQLTKNLQPVPLFGYPVAYAEYLMRSGAGIGRPRPAAKVASVINDMEKAMVEACIAQYGGQGRSPDEKVRNHYLLTFTKTRQLLSILIEKNETDYAKYAAAHNEDENKRAVLSVMAVMMAQIVKVPAESLKKEAILPFSILNTQLANTTAKTIHKFMP